MEDKRADISQIKKYLKGDLDAKAMHRLEREAQDDPFLADAMDGYAAAGNQDDALAALQERLQQRTTPKVRRLVPWTMLAIAASVIGFVIVAGLFFMKDGTKDVPQVAMNQQPLKSAPASDSPAVATKIPSPTVVQAEAPVLAQAKPAKQYSAPPTVYHYADKNSLAAAEANDQLKQIPEKATIDDAIVGYMANKRQDTVLGGENVAITKKPSEITVLKSKVESATYKANENSRTSNTAYALANLPPGFSGKVLDRANGLPLPGAQVKVVGEPKGTITDVNGRFTLPDVKPDDKVAIAYVGYNSKVLPAKPGDSVKVALDGASNALSEVVVTRTISKNHKAMPVTGWQDYNNYLKENAFINDGEQAGTVGLSFTVGVKGEITGIKVTKHLSEQADKRAIALITNGPAWLGNSNGKPEVVKLNVKFEVKE